MSEAVKYLTMVDQLTEGKPSLFRLILEHGHRFTAWATCPRSHIGPPGNCYNNAAMMVLDDPRRYAYTEGYATSLVPVEHAWVFDRFKRVIIDPTWVSKNIAQPNPAEYVGLMFRSPYLRAYIQRYKQAALIMGNAGHAYDLAYQPELRARALILPAEGII